ncbi:hypothetical protein SAMN05421687_101150 [Salimicrobium flavidum]|uniref:Uncharacterized protein n=1 Tax=Salimicrobium flavidum TaxID=570947 RepID=A0A1N7IIN0_9BACI|nr:hypothetical protein SAMN05421687_101150 [Salimicrobium flavidum]
MRRIGALSSDSFLSTKMDDREAERGGMIEYS